MLLFPKKVVRTYILKIQIENYVQRKIKPLMIQIRPFKEKEKERGEGRSYLGGQWKVPLFGGPWKVPLLGGPWKVPLFSGL
jgi:hypothetical protein